MSVEKLLNYRGDIKAIVGVGSTLAFVTVHPEAQPTALYRLDADALTLASDPLPRGALSVVADGETLWVGGDEGQVFEASAKGGKVKPRGAVFAKPPIALAIVADNRLAVLTESEIAIVDRKDGKVRQTLELPEIGTCLAVDPTGRWLAAGGVKGTVAVFEAGGKDQFDLSATGQVHERAVTALAFQTDDLRFLSAGVDQKLLSTHARGRLEPEDRGRGANHTDVVTAIVWGPAERFYTGSRDGTIKAWPKVGNVRPSTVKDGVGRVTALGVVEIHGKHRLVAACDDNTLRIFPLDEAGKVEELATRVGDAYARAASELGQNDPRHREAALRELAGYADTRASDLISHQVGGDADPSVRLLGTKLLGEIAHPRAATLLETWLGHPDEAARIAAFEGLRRHLGPTDLRPIELALKAERPDVGKLAVQALETLAPRDDEAMRRLVGTLDAKSPDVRQAALYSLEKAHPADSPEAALAALASKFADVRRLALLRLHQRGLLGHPMSRIVLRRRGEDPDPEVRRVAFLLSLFTREPLLLALRDRDPDLARQLDDLEGTKAKSGAKVKPSALTPDDFDPLLQATASRELDTSLRGARGLAMLGDPRAFGLLLQLSREEDKTARAEVCRALAALDDPRAVERLRMLLFDKEPEVRDAAFTAVERLYQKDPLLAAASGLSSEYPDVRLRGLKVLLDFLRGEAHPSGLKVVLDFLRPSAAQDANATAWRLLVHALNDSMPTVRAEAFRAILNAQLGGGGVKTLKFLLQSIHDDIRRQVLTEAMAQVTEPWGWDLILEFFNDPEARLRDEAFTFATAKIKGHEFLDAALSSRYVDVRKKAVDNLIKKPSAAAQTLLVKALDDEDRTVRQAALGSIVGRDARPALLGALKASHADVRARAARALARHGDPAALSPLLALATEPEPDQPERKNEWKESVELALQGLGELGDPSSLTALIPYLDSAHAPLRKAAAGALVWVSRPGSLDTLKMALQHADPEVKLRAALGLSLAGDTATLPLLESDAGQKILSAEERLAAALLAPGDDSLIRVLDHPRIPGLGLLALMLLERKLPQPTPTRLIAALASRQPLIRLLAARGLQTVADPAAFLTLIVEIINDCGDQPPRKIKPQTVDELGDLLCLADPLTRARTALLLKNLEQAEQAAWDLAWSTHRERYAAELKSIQEAAKKRPAVALKDAATLHELAFGAYVGLLRAKSSKNVDVSKLRETALRRIKALAEKEPKFARAARPVLIQAMGDPNATVRGEAFEQLQASGLDAAALGWEALSTGHDDLGVKGLEVLAAAGGAGGDEVIERAMLQRTDALAVEAAKLLIDRQGTVPVAGKALAGVSETLRLQAVAWLAAEVDTDPRAVTFLREALNSRHEAIREAAAVALARRKDPDAFDALVKLLKTTPDKNRQRRVIAALVQLGDPRTPDALLDRIEDDPGGTAPVDVLIKMAGQFRRAESADRLIKLMVDRPKSRTDAFNALLVVSGYDQSIEDPEDELPDRRWEKDLHPWHDDVLARVLERLTSLNEPRLLTRLIPFARWARGKQVEPALAALLNHADEPLRRAAVEAYGWRVRKRGAGHDPLVKALSSRDPISQFFAAEALARAGRPEGLSVLLSSVDFVSDLQMRRRAVLALGELADDRALDLLLKLAAEDGHALQETAAEALGHLGRSEKAQEIAKLLERYGRGDGGLALHALKGLRWLNTRDAWQLIRRRAADPAYSDREGAIELLGYNDDPATRDLLLKILATDGTGYFLDPSLASARRIWGKDSVEPDEALIQNENSWNCDDIDESIDRVCRGSDPARIFALLPKASEAARGPLASSVLNRPNPPLAEARAALDSPDALVVGLAARVIGRSGSAASDSGTRIATALGKWQQEWGRIRAEMARRREDDFVTASLRDGLGGLAWAAGRLGVATETLAAMTSAYPDDLEYRAVRLEAVRALASAKSTPATLKALEAASIAGDPECRSLAADALARLAPARVPALAERMTSDRTSFQRVARTEGAKLGEVARKAARQAHTQGVVLPLLIADRDTAGLAAVAADKALNEPTRLGAIEGLAALGLDEAEKALREIGTSAKDDEEIRKAAWRGLRRSKRAKAKVKVTP